MSELPGQVYPADTDEALAVYMAWLRRSAEDLAAGHTHLARQDLLATVAGFVEWLLQHFEPQEHDHRIVETLLEIAAGFLEGHLCRLALIFTPKDTEQHGPKPLSVAEVRYRAFAGLAAQIRLRTSDGERDGAGACDKAIAEAIDWVDDDSVLVGRLGGALTKNTVRNARLDIENNRGPIAAYARGIPVPTGTVEEQATWLRAQVADRKGAAYAT